MDSWFKWVEPILETISIKVFGTPQSAMVEGGASTLKGHIRKIQLNFTNIICVICLNRVVKT
jgi:hypothetical protein